LKPGKPSLGLKAFLDIKLDEYFPEIRPYKNSWDTLGIILDNMAPLRDTLSEAQAMEFAFAALLCASQETSLKFLERITNETHLLKIVPPLLKAYQELDTAIVNDAPALRRLAVKLGGLKLLGMLVKCTPREFYAGSTADGECFADKLWNVASELELIEEAPQPYLMGKMLMDMDVKPGKQMGEIIKQSFELQLDGEIKNVEEAIAWAKSRLS
jgi:tRNA nucleotidyltransferase (CCA-adding enzyme)